ncbi:5'-deoxynucleotidase hdd1-like isoform X2 [Nymphaea colorata]|uniref:5'-deoxynucleotidase hdd1-like isoform X2 n=1 Tax=Nymphaea colorata TaxID=210225 RepID=UPI00129E3A71|nr:5'-deoxynucleotidase hdd1-like isoform X2 [Nymphaea colorata]
MGLNSALSSSSLFYQPFPSSSPSSSSSHSFPAHHSFLVTPNSLKLLMHKGSLSPAPILINLTKKSFSRFFAAASGDSTSHREFPTTACGNGAPLSSSSSAIDFLTLCHRLKTTKRKGWINHGIKNPESIADHMYLMAVMALIANDIPGVDRERCIKIAIVHDIAEAIVGDITPSDGVPKAEKSRRELEALTYMCELLGEQARADEVKELWGEYENNSSLEAKLVKDFDKSMARSWTNSSFPRQGNFKLTSEGGGLRR